MFYRNFLSLNIIIIIVFIIVIVIVIIIVIIVGLCTQFKPLLAEKPSQRTDEACNQWN